MDGEMISKAIEPLDQFAARPKTDGLSLCACSALSSNVGNLSRERASERVSDQECQLCVNNPPSFLEDRRNCAKEEFECGLADQRSAESELSESRSAPLTYLDETGLKVGSARKLYGLTKDIIFTNCANCSHIWRITPPRLILGPSTSW